MKNVKTLDEINESIQLQANARRMIKDLTELVEKYDVTIVASHRGLEIEDNTDRESKIVLPNLINKKTLDDFMKRMMASMKKMSMSINNGKTGYVPTEDDIIGVVK